MRSILGLFVALLHAGCNEVGGKGAPFPPASGWVFQYSPGMAQPTPDGQGGVYFDFPSQDGVHYLVHRRTSPLAGDMALQAEVVISDGAKLIGPPDPKNTCPDPAHLSLYFQRRGDDFTASKPNHRWWAPPGFETIKPGPLDITVPLSADLWTQVFGKHDPQGFAQAMAQPQAIGLTFGAGCFAGHGLFVTGGTARFHIRSFTAQ